jgi:CP family cyanate transporter-like MFS transporter
VSQLISDRESLRRGIPIFIAAMSMRAGLTIMNPLIPTFEHQYHLNSFASSFLSSLSILCFAGAGLLMSLVAKIGGTERIIAFSLSVVTLAIFLRTIGNLPVIFFTSLLIGLAIAVLNFSLPVWVKENDAEHSGLLTGVYITVMGIFASAAIAVAVPLSHLTSWGWRFSMVPLILFSSMSSIWWLLKVRSTERPGKKIDLPKFHLSTFRNFGAWSIGLFFGIQSLIYYSTATWFPTILISKGFTSNNAGFAVAATGLIGALVGILAPHYASKLPNIRGLLVALSFMLAISFIGLMVDTGWHLVIWLVVASIALSITFPLSLMLAVTRGVGPGETRSLSIMSQSVGYALAFFGPGLVGATFDASKNWNVALVVPLLFSLILALIGYFAGKPEKIHLR